MFLYLRLLKLSGAICPAHEAIIDPLDIDKSCWGGRMRFFESYLKPLRGVNIGSIARETEAASKASGMSDRRRLRISAFCDSLQSGEAAKKGLISISKAISGE
jgi:hypothetical protein